MTTQAPTPGPLSGDDVKLLVKGDLLRRTDGAVGQFERLSISGLVVWNPYREKRDPHEILSFIGRPDADGWMPWSGGENPVPGQRVDVRFRDGFFAEQSSVSEEWDWSHNSPERRMAKGADDIIAFRLAPTAPVEAGGSERERLISAMRDHIELGEIGSCSAAIVGHEEAADAILALRPQPSGETQEALARKIRNAIIDRTSIVDGTIIDGDLDEAIEDILALFRPPALGGQQGEIVAYRQWCVSDKPHQGGWWPLIEKHDGDHAIATGGGKNLRPLYDTTPARAEAQDEGAAGEWPEKWSGPCMVGNMIANLRTLPPEMPIYTAYHIPMDGEPSLLRVKRPTMSRERVDGITIKTGDESVPYSAVIWTQPQNPLEAHPSPTPAADADRVRIADADAKWLARWLGDQKEGGHCGEGNVERRERAIWNDRIDRILAALKSEGK